MPSKRKGERMVERARARGREREREGARGSERKRARARMRERERPRAISLFRSRGFREGVRPPMKSAVTVMSDVMPARGVKNTRNRFTWRMVGITRL